ncbi:DNA-binding GntR family transcriptional regulator [Azospirillum lipoferum]|uniref:GntR family transcriptional regulator n=1 Tax=Azospirillum lipoferum TaxID=193 RepID=A0A5A9GIN5_AZOLI|nr:MULTISPECIES: GntR family transcriptional regulator [Azospirillum]KAA0594358.1 GntR family transcriptional regulator [Azospirillum lipoferum]MCP1613091.1 DNA-binding GntR family transcriptional regulator [Azospirillum lipoferum]MDW5531291.1 GntR family transcriptional regulator [Azospirillum sp. NL1]
MDTVKTARASAGPIRRETLHHGAVAELRAMILSGELRPGNRVPEVQLCEQLGISRTPLREALRVLAAEGLVELRPHRGAVVTPIDPKEIAAVFEVMEALEALAGSLCCQRGTLEEFAELDRLHAQLHARFDAGDRPAYFMTDRRIHIRIVAMARNPSLEATYAGFASKILRARSLANDDAERWRNSLGEHDGFMAAFRQRDAAAAGSLLAAHSRQTAEAVLTVLNGCGKPSPVQPACRPADHTPASSDAPGLGTVVDPEGGGGTSSLPSLRSR